MCMREYESHYSHMYVCVAKTYHRGTNKPSPAIHTTIAMHETRRQRLPGDKPTALSSPLERKHARTATHRDEFAGTAAVVPTFQRRRSRFHRLTAERLGSLHAGAFAARTGETSDAPGWFLARRCLVLVTAAGEQSW